MTRSFGAPASVGPSADGLRLRIEWPDGDSHEFPPRLLRILCPCAGCVDERTGERILDPSMVAEEVAPLAIHWVGRYALQFVWSDGHRTGIYPFEFLWRIGEGDFRG